MIVIESVELQGEQVTSDGYIFIKLLIGYQNAAVGCRYYASEDAKKAVILVGGIGGGWDSPARGLYPQLSQNLLAHRISSLQIRYRYPADLDECVKDVIAGLKFLEHKRFQSVGLVGHSFGGAVIIKAAASIPNIVRTVVTLSTQSYGAVEAVSQLRQGCSILLIHGTDDDILRPICSSYVYKRANNPKQIILYEGAKHGLEEAAEQIHRTVYQWLLEYL
jgi:pimeloyl-ACP methyl ester carboxylesterase